MQRKILIGAVAGGLVLGAGAVAGAAVGAGPFERTDDASETTSTSRPDDQPEGDLPIGSSQTFPAGDAGFVTVRRAADGLHVVSTTTADGWTAQLGDDTGHEVRVTFTNADGTVVTFEAELEHGGVRVGVDHQIELVANRGPGSADRGPGTSGAPAPTNAGVPTSPPPTVDDHGGRGSSRSSGSGDSGGADDAPGHDAGDDHGGSGGAGGSSGSGGSSDHGGSSGPG